MRVLYALACVVIIIGGLKAAAPLLVPIVLERWDTNGDWSEAFLLFSAGYLVAAVASLGINAKSTVE